MEIRICKNPDELGKSAAKFVADELRKIIKEKGYARIALSTGASQFDTIKHLVNEDVEWSKVDMFHLDEYVDLAETHPASFRKYLNFILISVKRILTKNIILISRMNRVISVMDASSVKI